MIVLDGEEFALEGVEGQSFVTRPELGLAAEDVRDRAPDEQVRAVMVHTTLGRLGPLLPGRGPALSRDERVIRMWRNDGRHAGAHIVIDFDGSTVCAADLRTQAAYHAGDANGWTVGIEIAQLRDGDSGRMYEAQLRTLVKLCDRITEAFDLPMTYPGEPLRGWPVLEQLSDRGAEADWQPKHLGVIGHVHYGFRGPGDPGAWPFLALATAGYCAAPGKLVGPPA